MYEPLVAAGTTPSPDAIQNSRISKKLGAPSDLNRAVVTRPN